MILVQLAPVWLLAGCAQPSAAPPEVSVAESTWNLAEGAVEGAQFLVNASARVRTQVATQSGAVVSCVLPWDAFRSWHGNDSDVAVACVRAAPRADGTGNVDAGRWVLAVKCEVGESCAVKAEAWLS